MAARRISDRDNGYKRLVATVGELARGAEVRVGVFSAGARKDGTTNAEIGAIAEYGLGASPERSWLRGWVDENKQIIVRNLRIIGKGVFRSRDEVRIGCDRFGLWAVGGIKRRIQAGIQPPDSAATIARKGSSTPLIDTAQFIGSIQHQTEIR